MTVTRHAATVRRFVIRAVMVLCLGGGPVVAQDLSALARLNPQDSSVADTDGGIGVALALSQPVPWRVRVLDAPPRLIMDFREVDWTGIDRVARTSGHVKALRAGVFRPGWSRLVIEMDAPFLVASAAMTTGDGAARIDVRLLPAVQADFAAKAALPEPPGWALPASAPPQPASKREPGPPIIVLDPGHGGIDPGAERDGVTEADLMLGFARELKEVLVRAGFRVVMTREDDVFVPLESRISIARAAHADVFVALHADALAEGEAVGATVYTLSDAASDAASAALAERHDRDDLLAGVDLSKQDDLVATVLMDMARTETEPRTARLSAALAGAMQKAGIKMHRHPEQSAGLSVLKSPDVPSVLIELGFLSSARDLARLNDPVWRAKMTQAIRDGLAAWGAQDQALQALLRK